MSGETQRDESGWTVDTLKHHYDQRFTDSDKAVEAALVAQEKAILKAETAADKRFELLNELRDGVATKEQIEALDKLVDGVASRLDRIEGRTGGLNASWGYLVGIVGLAATIIGVILAFNG